MNTASDGRVTLVTGASRGIGRATALALAQSGHRVAIGWSRDEEGASKTVAEVEAAGAEAVAVQADVGERDAVEAAFASVESRWAPVEVLVNAAGVTRDGLLLRMGDEQWAEVLRTNLDGTFHCVRRASAGMVRARWGRIVNVGSAAGMLGSAGQVNYATAKAGLVGLTRSVARELASRGVTCNLVTPGPIATAMLDAVGEDRRRELAEAVPLGRLGTVEEVAAVIAFLCSDDAAYVTGAVVPVDGGLGMGH